MDMAPTRPSISKHTPVAVTKTNRPLHLKDSVNDAAGIQLLVSALSPPATTDVGTTDPGHCIPVGLADAYNACAPPTV